MARLINLDEIIDPRGSLTVIENKLPFDIKRVFYLYDVKSQRGGHAHKKTQMAIACPRGRCEIYTNDGISENTFILEKPNQLLILKPSDWHTMNHFSDDALLLVLASENYDSEDYIFENPELKYD